MPSPPAIAPDVLTRLVAGPSRPSPGPEASPAERHSAEYREPSIWLWRRIVGTALAFIVVTIGWYLVKLPEGLVSDHALPTQTQVAIAFNELRTDGFAGAPLSTHVAATLARLVLGVMIGLSMGGLLGLATGSSPMLRTVADPILSLLRMMPAMALGPLVLLWADAGEVTVVGVVAVTVLFTSLDAVDTLRVRRLRGCRDDMVHGLASGLRRLVAAGWAAVLAVETVVAPVGLGPMIWSAQQRSDLIVAGLYVIGMLGLLLDTMIRVAEYLVELAGPLSSGPGRR